MVPQWGSTINSSSMFPVIIGYGAVSTASKWGSTIKLSISIHCHNWVWCSWNGLLCGQHYKVTISVHFHNWIPLLI